MKNVDGAGPEVGDIEIAVRRESHPVRTGGQGRLRPLLARADRAVPRDGVPPDPIDIGFGQIDISVSRIERHAVRKRKTRIELLEPAVSKNAIEPADRVLRAGAPRVREIAIASSVEDEIVGAVERIPVV